MGPLTGLFSLFFLGAITYVVYGLFKKKERKSYLKRGGLAAIASFIAVGIFASLGDPENSNASVEINSSNQSDKAKSDYFDLGESSIPDVSTNLETSYRWCDTMIPLMPELDPIIEFEEKSKGHFVVTASHPDGSAGEQVLTISGVIWDTQNDHGEYYKITKRGGLEIYDDQGIIRTIPKVTGLGKPGDCRNNIVK